MRRLTILIASLIIMVLGLWGSAVIYLDEDRLKGIVAEHLAQQTGRKLEIRGSLKVRFFPQLHLRAEQIVVSGPAGYDGPELLAADHLSMSVRLLPLIRGGISAGEVSLSGATLHLHTNREGQSSFDGLTSTSSAPLDQRNGQDLLSTRRMRLEDVRLVITDVAAERSDTIMIDWVELDRFSFDRPLQFHFRGNVGDPVLFYEMTIQGQLNVPSTRHRHVRLSNMRMSGRLIDTGQPVTLLGHLAVSPAPPLTFTLDDGRLEIDNQAFALAVSYDGQERGHLKLQTSGRILRWPLIPGSERSDNHGLLPFLRGMDIDAEFAFDQLIARQMAFESVSAQVRAREGIVAFSRIEGLFPGVMAQGRGRLNTQLEPPRGELDLQLDVADAREMLSALGVPAVLSGSGVSTVTMQFAGALEGQEPPLASGRFELWDGHWKTSQVPDGDDSGQLGFSRMAGEFRLASNHFALPELSLQHADMEALGWAAVNLEDHSVGGKLIFVADGREVDLSGTLSNPHFSEPLPVPAEDDGQPETTATGLSTGM